MSLEVVNSIASIATLLVIAATAIAALGQLRHMRGSNQIVALTECREVLESESFSQALRFVRRELSDLMQDPDVRARLMRSPIDEDLRPVITVGNFFESMGSFVKHDIIDAEIACDIFAGPVMSAWRSMAPAIAIMRRDDRPALWENFEYLAAVMTEYDERHPEGGYPKSVRRMPVPDVWKEADEAAGIIPRQ
jgi:hypothetical protein